MKRRSWIILALIVAAIAAYFVWKRLNPPPAVDPFKTQAAQKGNLTEEITANGIINPVRVVSVGTQVSGTVQALYADFNDRVKAGQLLLRLDPALFNSRLQASEAALTNVRANAALQAANAARAAQLVKQDFISKQEFETAQASARSTAAQVAQAEAQIRQDRANLEFSVIRSPVAGVVISRQIDIGQTVAASFNTPTLFQIARDLTQMQIEASIAEADIAKVKAGQAVDFTVDAFGARRFTGTVNQVRLNPTTQQNVVTYTVIVKAANPDGALLPGMTANANFVVSQYKDMLLVPNAALSFKPEGYKPARSSGPRTPQADTVTLFVLENGKAMPRRVHAGAADADNTVITGGPLKAGDIVITGSNTAVKPAGGLFSGPPGQKPKDPNAKRASERR
ncbi:MAG: efflux RND transporter periplasmic adaptor subunit [Sandarakinorhabdus sp.]|nr:efflux RND transporter periplasmic adaptor subunit [Sandarakinorhabdus sp.]